MSKAMYQLKEAVRLSRLQAASMHVNPFETLSYLHAARLFEKHLSDNLENMNCDYLRGVLDAAQSIAGGEDTELQLAIWNTLGLVHDGAEWDERLESARMELRAKGVEV